MVFVEAPDFSARVQEYLTDESYREFQNLLMRQPDLGRVVPGCGGLRKVRIADPRRRKGKRGGIRILYVHVPEVHRVFLLDLYGKDQRDDMNALQKKLLAQAVRGIKLDCVRPFDYE
jgi:hypothetical protein